MTALSVSSCLRINISVVQLFQKIYHYSAPPFAGDGTKVSRAEELHQIDLRNVVDVVFSERLDVPLIAPVVD